MKFNIRTGRPATPGLEARFPGSRENIVGRDGNINGWDKKDVMRSMATLMKQVQSGEVITSDAKTQREEVKTRREVLTAAYSDRNSNQWAALGSDIAGQITEAADREGFMRRLLFRSELDMGNVPRIRVKRKQVTALVMTTDSQVHPQYVRDTYLYPPEFSVVANIRVEQREINQGTGDIMQDKFNEGQEAILVQEDRVWKTLADNTAGIDHPLKYLAGGLSPTSFSEMRTDLNRFNINAMNCVMAADYWNDIIANSNFQTWFDPLTKYEIVTTGTLGEMLGITFITDGFRQENLRVLNAGDIYIVGEPDTHGSYTDRGPVQSNEVANYPDGSPARGWYFWEDLSAVIGNTRSVVVGRRA